MRVLVCVCMCLRVCSPKHHRRASHARSAIMPLCRAFGFRATKHDFFLSHSKQRLAVVPAQVMIWKIMREESS